LPDQIVSASDGGKDAILQTGNIRIPLAIVPNATGRIIWGAGRHNNEEAVTLELRVEMPATGEKSPSYVLSLLNKAHSAISSWFEALISDQLRSHFGDRREAGNG
jgi:hypothetical protein